MSSHRSEWRWLSAEFVQQRAGESGLICLALALERFDIPTSMATLRSRNPPTPRGLSPRQLGDIARAHGLEARIVDLEPSDVDALAANTILPSTLGEYVLFGEAKRNKVRLYEPTTGWKWVRRDIFTEGWSGEAIELRPRVGFEPSAERPKLHPLKLMNWTPEVRRTIAQSLVLSGFLQLYILASPLYMRIVLDDVIQKGDVSLLLVCALGFALLGVFNALASLLRSLTLQTLGVLTGWDMQRRTFAHAIRLPLEWFQSRQMADVLSKISSIEQIRSVMTSSFTVLVDGLLSIATFVLLLVFAPQLAAIAALGLALYLAMRFVAVPVMLRLNSRNVLASVAESGKRMETIRFVQTIKALGLEAEQEAVWSGRLARSMELNQETSLAQTLFGALQSITSTLVGICIIYIGARAVLANEMSVGLLTAALAYQGQFSQRSTSLFETLLSWRMLDVQLNRLADVVLEKTEKEVGPGQGAARPTRGDVELRDVCFRYSETANPVLKDINLKIAAGANIAITGVSGGGKTTLLKLISGLYTPTSGHVLIDGRTIDSWGAPAVRGAIGFVLQDDQLLSGTVGENVAGFRDDADTDLIWRCLESVGMAEEVRGMEFGLDTFVGDLGAPMSGGQKQRLILARALYRRPPILLLDEATSHLDLAKEKSIVAALTELNVTRIVVAHRPQTIAAADTVYRIADGRLEAVPKTKVAPGSD